MRQQTQTKPGKNSKKRCNRICRRPNGRAARRKNSAHRSALNRLKRPGWRQKRQGTFTLDIQRIPKRLRRGKVKQNCCRLPSNLETQTSWPSSKSCKKREPKTRI